MKILITGGYGFIGSFVAEKFFKEGHEVIIIDNMSSGNVTNCPFRHTSYIADVESTVCESIFQNHEIDVVIHLAAQINVVTSMENPYADTKSNILGLTNILQLSVKHKVKKFIFASSAAVYGLNDQIPLSEEIPCQPVSPYGINKLLGEYYCTKWNELYELNTLCFRFANVYGPRQGSVGEGGVVSIFMERLRDGKELVVYGDGGQTRDFVYVEDVADVIYMGSLSQQTGIMNLSTNTENSVNQLIEILTSMQPAATVVTKETRYGDIYRSRLDNSLLKQSLSWVPKFSLEEGLQRTFAWFSQSLHVQAKVTEASQAEQTKPGSALDAIDIDHELINSSLSRNIRSLYLSQTERYIEDKPVLKPEVFTAVVRSRQQAKRKFNANFALLALSDGIIDDKSLLDTINGLLRESDYIGLTKNNQVLILLSNSSLEDAHIVVKRLKPYFDGAKVIDKEDSFYIDEHTVEHIYL
ncbi:NAD-dependent epimerase/dehydratase family protein [Paenibacillus sp. YAF4_2]|uniref:NAD-dependent epimerase/dehydratase family protein n=1 Tax=Paenibacillus sp. YAF4_2 TaxID=3233085 RepID=UPI003F9E6829